MKDSKFLVPCLTNNRVIFANATQRFSLRTRACTPLASACAGGGPRDALSAIFRSEILNRREFNKLCGALGSFVLSSPALAIDAGNGVVTSTGPGRTVKFRDGTIVPALGQGSWHLAQGRHPAAEEEEALRTGLSLGMTLIDTAEAYSNGNSEKLISHVIAGQRDHVFLVSKVLPTHVTGDGIARACDASLDRSALTTSIFICCTGAMGLRTCPTSSLPLNVYARKESFALGASPTSRSAIWKTCFVFRKAIAAQPIRSLTISPTAALNMICCHGASGTACR